MLGPGERDEHNALRIMAKPTKIAGGISVLIAVFVAPAELNAKGGAPDLEGVWKSTYVSLDDPRWRIEDLACRSACSVVGFEYLQALLRDPQNDVRSLKELMAEVAAHSRAHNASLLTESARKQQAEYDPSDDPAVDCDPDGDGWRHQFTAPPPYKIEQHDGKVIIRYEYWNAVRTVYMDGRGHPPDEPPSRLGHSIGWYEGQTLVVETAAIIPSLISLPGGYVRHSGDARGIERYTRSADGQRLDLEWAIVDPENFREPYRGQKSTLLEPDWELEEFVCEAITGEF